MKKIDDLLDQVDQRVEHAMAPFWVFIQKYFVIFSATLLTLLLVIFFVKVFQDSTAVLGSVIKDDLLRIERFLNQIDKECNILSIRADRAFIDFLTVEKFVGSTVGCLNLAYPKRWKGPYTRQNPSVQGKLYEIIRTKEGYFVLPGRGVKLPNGLVIGKDIVVDDKVSLVAMLHIGGWLNYHGQQLGLRLKFEVGDWDTPRPAPETIEKISQTLKEFHEALPFAKGEERAGVVVC